MATPISPHPRETQATSPPPRKDDQELSLTSNAGISVSTAPSLCEDVMGSKQEEEFNDITETWSLNNLEETQLLSELAFVDYINNSNILEKWKPRSFNLQWPDRSPTSGKTLVIDLDETLIYTGEVEGITDRIKLHLRPYLLNFLEAIYPAFEIVLYTAGEKEYVQQILLANMQLGIFFDKVLHRSSCAKMKTFINTNITFIKSLKVFRNRDPHKIIIVDDRISSWPTDLSNLIPVNQYTGDEQDKTLILLKNLLKTLEDSEGTQVAIANYYQQL